MDYMLYASVNMFFFRQKSFTKKQWYSIKCVIKTEFYFWTFGWKVIQIFTQLFFMVPPRSHL